MDVAELLDRIGSEHRVHVYDLVVTRDEDVMIADDSGLSDLSVFMRYSRGILIIDLDRGKVYHISGDG